MESSATHRRRLRMWDLGQTNPREPGDEQSEIGRSSASANVEPKANSLEIGDELGEACAKALSEGPQALAIDGFCELPNGFDRSCRTKTIGPQTVNVVYQDSLDSTDKRRLSEGSCLDEIVHLDLDHVGKFHGVLTAHTAEGFHVAVDPKFSGLLLTKLARYMAHELPAQQRLHSAMTAQPSSQRIVPKCSFCTYRDSSGILHKGSLVSISPLDAMVKTRTLPELNSLISFCGRRQRKAHVIRRLESGFVALFVDPLSDPEFTGDIRLTDEFSGFP